MLQVQSTVEDMRAYTVLGETALLLVNNAFQS
jgi:hypothetical protein